MTLTYKHTVFYFVKIHNVKKKLKLLKNRAKIHYNNTDCNLLFDCGGTRVMGNDFYLLAISVSGIKNIEKEVTLNFYKRGIDKSFNPEKYRIKAIYGENGAGKSALMTSVGIFKDLIIDEDYLKKTEIQKLLQELINKKTMHFCFQCEFLNDNEGDNSIYRYTVELRRNEKEKYIIAHEQLEIRSGNYPQSRFKDVYVVNNGVLEYFEGNKESKEFINKVSINLLESRTLISIFFQNIKDAGMSSVSIEVKLALILCVILAYSIKVYLAGEDRHDLYFAQKILKEEFSRENVSGEFVKYFNKCLVEYSGVNETRIFKEDYENYKARVKSLTAFIKLFKKDLQEIEIDDKPDGDYLNCELILNYGGYKIAKEFESTGIKKLISLYDCLDSASRGGIVFIDEMDSNLNDVYLCCIIEYIMYYGKGQLCFTTHNIDPMNVLKENKKSIDFLSSDNILVPWIPKGNATPDNSYKHGYIKNLPFNIDSTDFLGILGVEE